jgi:hypothetical protein
LIRSLGALVVLVLVVASLWYSQAPPRTAVAYRKEAVHTLEYLRSQVNTARIWVRELDDNDTFLPAASVAFHEVETDGRTTVSRFAGYDPPAGLDRLHFRVSMLGYEVVAALERLRIHAHRSDVAAATRMSRPLDRSTAELEGLMRQVAR